MTKNIKHYKIDMKDWNDLKEGKEVFFYNGNEVDIYVRLSEEVAVDIGVVLPDTSLPTLTPLKEVKKKE